MSETDSGFTCRGYESVPNLYTDNTYLIPKLAEVRSERLCDVQAQYTDFVSGEILPHHRAQAERVLAHIAFELGYRNGLAE